MIDAAVTSAKARQAPNGVMTRSMLRATVAAASSPREDLVEPNHYNRIFLTKPRTKIKPTILRPHPFPEDESLDGKTKETARGLHVLRGKIKVDRNRHFLAHARRLRQGNLIWEVDEKAERTGHSYEVTDDVKEHGSYSAISLLGYSEIWEKGSIWVKFHVDLDNSKLVLNEGEEFEYHFKYGVPYWYHRKTV